MSSDKITETQVTEAVSRLSQQQTAFKQSDMSVNTNTATILDSDNPFEYTTDCRSTERAVEHV